MKSTKATTNNIALKDVGNRAKELQERIESQIQMSEFNTSISFEPAKTDYYLHEGNILGRIETAVDSVQDKAGCDDATEARCNVGNMTAAINSQEVMVSATLDISEPVWSVTTLSDWICVLCRNPTSIRFYQNIHPYRIYDEIKAATIASPWSMKACSSNICLYVTDRDGKCVWRVVPADTTVTKWLPNIGDPYRLSVTNEGQVSIVKWGYPATVDIYGPQAHLVKSFNLPKHIKEPRDAILTSLGTVIITHKSRDSGHWGVCEVTRMGQIVRQFAPVNESQQLNIPNEISVDSQGRVFIADYNNCRVILLNPELNWDRIIISSEKDGRQKPRSLCYEETRKQLLVAYEDKIQAICL